MTTRPATNLTGFVNYATARPTARASAIRRAELGDYNPRGDFYRRMRVAVQADRRTARDGSAVEAAVVNADSRRKPRFARLTANWEKIYHRWDSCKPHEIHRVEVDVAGLSLSVSPTFAELRPDGILEIVVVRYAENAHSIEDLDMILRVVQRAYRRTHPAAVVVCVDLWGARLRTSEGRDLTRHDTRIETDAAGLAYALRNAA